MSFKHLCVYQTQCVCMEKGVFKASVCLGEKRAICHRRLISSHDQYSVITKFNAVINDTFLHFHLISLMPLSQAVKTFV